MRSLGVQAACLVVRASVDDGGAEAVWYPDAREGCCVDTVDVVLCCTGIDAVAIDNLDLTRSRGYVVPGVPGENKRVIEMMKKKQKDRTDKLRLFRLEHLLRAV